MARVVLPSGKVFRTTGQDEKDDPMRSLKATSAGLKLTGQKIQNVKAGVDLAASLANLLGPAIAGGISRLSEGGEEEALQEVARRKVAAKSFSEDMAPAMKSMEEARAMRQEDIDSMPGDLTTVDINKKTPAPKVLSPADQARLRKLQARQAARQQAPVAPAAPQLPASSIQAGAAPITGREILGKSVSTTLSAAEEQLRQEAMVMEDNELLEAVMREQDNDRRRILKDVRDRRFGPPPPPGPAQAQTPQGAPPPGTENADLDLLGKEFDAAVDAGQVQPQTIGRQLLRNRPADIDTKSVDLGEQAAAEATAPGKVMGYADALARARANPTAENVQASIQALRASNYRGVRPTSLSELISGAHLVRAENEIAKTTQIPKQVKKKTPAQIKAEAIRDTEKARQLTSKGKREDIALTEAEALQKENKERRPARTESVLARRDINNLNASIARIKADPTRLKALAVRLDKAHTAEEKRSEVRLAEFKNRLRRTKGDEEREKVEKLIKAEELKLKQAQVRKANAARMLTNARRRALKDKPKPGEKPAKDTSPSRAAALEREADAYDRLVVKAAEEAAFIPTKPQETGMPDKDATAAVKYQNDLSKKAAAKASVKKYSDLRDQRRKDAEALRKKTPPPADRPAFNTQQ